MLIGLQILSMRWCRIFGIGAFFGTPIAITYVVLSVFEPP